MSAMHWEARRRQSALERRTAHRQQPLLEDNASSGPLGVSEPGPSAESTVDEQCPHCKCTLKTLKSLKTSDSTPKVPNRYSSLQYKQQW